MYDEFLAVNNYGKLSAEKIPFRYINGYWEGGMLLISCSNNT